MLIGYIISLIMQPLIFYIFNIHINLSQDMEIGILFTFVSLLRSYLIRRLFNYIHIKDSV